MVKERIVSIHLIILEVLPSRRIVSGSIPAQTTQLNRFTSVDTVKETLKARA